MLRILYRIFWLSSTIPVTLNLLLYNNLYFRTYCSIFLKCLLSLLSLLNCLFNLKYLNLNVTWWCPPIFRLKPDYSWPLLGSPQLSAHFFVTECTTTYCYDSFPLSPSIKLYNSTIMHPYQSSDVKWKKCVTSHEFFTITHTQFLHNTFLLFSLYSYSSIRCSLSILSWSGLVLITTHNIQCL